MEDTDNMKDPVTMRDTVKKPRGRGLLFAGAAAVAVVGTAGYFLTTTNYAPAPAPSPATSVPGTAAAGVAAGSGGNTLGADGVTRVGYEPTCEGAEQAATNYTAGELGYGNVPDEKHLALINQIFLPDSADRIKEAQRIHDKIANPATKGRSGDYIQAHPEWGGAYKIFGCEPGKKASIAVLQCSKTHFEQPYQGNTIPDSYGCSDVFWSLAWAGDGDARDWKVSGLGNFEQEGISGAKQLPSLKALSVSPTQESEYPVSASLLARMLVNLEGAPLEGWADYANVTRK
ncbi:hypothetical protein [Arthrobacter sp. NyZ413]|uniref:hypothetical protein n=1 Tax=Arthrobacter sp. NyZ413 TaxID=3144669 RepID=UPI003BF81C1E